MKFTQETMVKSKCMKLKKNIRERKVQVAAIKQGWEVLWKGWPDFLLYDKKTGDHLFVEVKGKTQEGTQAQKKMHQILRKLRLKVRVVKVL